MNVKSLMLYIALSKQRNISYHGNQVTYYLYNTSIHAYINGNYLFYNRLRSMSCAINYDGPIATLFCWLYCSATKLA